MPKLAALIITALATFLAGPSAASAAEVQAGVRYCGGTGQVRLSADVTGSAMVMVAGYTVKMGSPGARGPLVFQAPTRSGYASWFIAADDIHSVSVTCLR